MALKAYDYAMTRKEQKVDAIAASLLMLSGAADADPALLQRIATKKASTDDVQSAVLRGGGTPTHVLRARDERAAGSPRQQL